jgi:prepilin-type N-terminal cleavage/methylation domain-containing protein
MKSWIKRADGFSLIELLIVFLVIAILAVVSVPMISKNLQLYRAESAVGMVSNRLSEARLTAIKRNRPVWLKADPANNSLNIESTDDSGNVITVSPPMFLPDDTSIASGSPVVTTFTSLGRVQSGSTTKTSLNFPAISRCNEIQVSSVGKISVASCPQVAD